MWKLISKVLFINSGAVSEFNAATSADYSKALWYNPETGETRNAVDSNGVPITDYALFEQRLEEGTRVGGGSIDPPGPTLEGGTVVPRPLTPAEIDEAIKTYYTDPNFVEPYGFFINEEGLLEEHEKDENGNYTFLPPGAGPNDPIPPITPDQAIQLRLGTQGVTSYLGFEGTLGTPLGYKGAGEGYGDNPVYITPLITTLFMDDMLGEDYIRNLQSKLVQAGYLVGGFESGSMDAPTEAAITAAMTTHNLEGRVPYFDDGFNIEGALLTLSTTVGTNDDGEIIEQVINPNTNEVVYESESLQQYKSQFAFTDDKKREIRDFFFGELDNDVTDLENRLLNNYSVDVPKYDTESAGYIAMNAVRNYFGGADKISFTQAQSLAGVVNSLLQVTKRDLDGMIVQNIREDIDAQVKQLGYDGWLDKYGSVDGYKQELKQQYPFADDEMLDTLVRNKINSFQVTTSQELGPSVTPADPFALTGVNDRFSSLFGGRLARAVDKIYGEEKDFQTRQSAFDSATANFAQASRNLRNLGRRG